MAQPLSDITAIHTDAPAQHPHLEPHHHCSKCHLSLPASNFPTKNTKEGTAVRTAVCQDCKDTVNAKRAAKKDAEDEALPIVDVATLRSFLEEYAAGSAKPCNVLEARVAIPSEGRRSEKEAVDSVAQDISKTMGWKFTYVPPCRGYPPKHAKTESPIPYSYKDKRAHISQRSVSYRYTCAQSAASQKKSKKKAAPEKQRDKQQMASFLCKGQVTVVACADSPEYVDITIKHCEDHVPYCSVTIPSDIRELVEKHKNMSMAQVSTLHPNARKFSN